MACDIHPLWLFWITFLGMMNAMLSLYLIYGLKIKRMV